MIFWVSLIVNYKDNNRKTIIFFQLIRKQKIFK